MKLWKIVAIVLVVAVACALLVGCNSDQKIPAAEAVVTQLYITLGSPEDLRASDISVLVFTSSDDTNPSLGEFTVYAFSITVRYTEGGTERFGTYYYTAIAVNDGFSVKQTDEAHYSRYSGKSYKSKASSLKGKEIDAVIAAAKAKAKALAEAEKEPEKTPEEIQAEIEASERTEAALNATLTAMNTLFAADVDVSVGVCNYYYYDANPATEEWEAVYVFELGVNYTRDGQKSYGNFYFVATASGAVYVAAPSTEEVFRASYVAERCVVGAVSAEDIATKQAQ